MLGSYVPGPQLVQLEAPVAGWYLPAAQLVQLVCPSDAWKSPAGQGEQGSVRPVEELYVPRAQLVQLEEPMAGWYFPAAQLAQLSEDFCPGEEENKPAAQLVHEVASSPENLPAGQMPVQTEVANPTSTP